MHGLAIKHQKKKTITPYLDMTSGCKPAVFVLQIGWKQRYRPKYYSAMNGRRIHDDIFFIIRIAHQNSALRNYIVHYSSQI